MNWMLVLFMGISPNYQVIKTDLVFAEKLDCFGFEKKMAKESVDAMNVYSLQWKKEGVDRDQLQESINWTALQMPRGTCIPTTSAVTLH
jgi:hypothetical protein